MGHIFLLMYHHLRVSPIKIVEEFFHKMYWQYIQSIYCFIMF